MRARMGASSTDPPRTCKRSAFRRTHARSTSTLSTQDLHGQGTVMRGVPDDPLGAAAGAEFWGRIAVDVDNVGEGQRPGQWYLHPAILDSALQLALASVPIDEEARGRTLPMWHIGRVLSLRPAPRRGAVPDQQCPSPGSRSYADIEVFIAGRRGRLQRCMDPAASGKSNPTGWLRAPLVCMPRGMDRNGRLQHGVAGTEKHGWFAGIPRAGALTAAMTAAGLRAVPCGFTKVPPDAERIIACAWSSEQIEPSAQTVLDADWPLVQLAQSLAAHPRAVRLLLVTAGATWGQPGVDSRVDPQQATRCWPRRDRVAAGAMPAARPRSGNTGATRLPHASGAPVGCT